MVESEGEGAFVWLYDLPFPALLWSREGELLSMNGAAQQMFSENELQVGEIAAEVFPQGTWEKLIDGRQSWVSRRAEISLIPERGGRRFMTAAQSVNGHFILYMDPFVPHKEEVDDWKTMVENVNEVIWRLDDHFNFIYISPRVERVRGRPASYYLGRNLKELAGPDDSNQMMSKAAARVKERPQDGKPLSMRVKERAPDGSELWTEITAVMVKREGRVEFLGSARDVTAQMRLEEELRNAKARLEATLRSLPDMHFEVDSDWRIVWFHGSASTATYLPPEDFMGRSPDEVLPTEAAAAVRSAGKQAEAEGIGVCRYTLPMADGIRHFEATVAMKEGERPTYIYSVRDITDGVHMMEALRAANQRISLLTHITRHDLINSMTVAEGNIRLCLEELDSSRLPERLEKVAKSLREMRGLIMFSKEYQDENRGEVSWHDISRMIRHEGQVLEAAGIELTVQDGLELCVDPMFRKVIRNLLENVARHARSASECHVTYAEVEGAVGLVFEDNGKGIPDKYRARLFQRGQGSNTGLGLYLSREILAIDGMSIDETSSPGQGARFILRVPKGKYRIKG